MQFDTFRPRPIEDLFRAADVAENSGMGVCAFIREERGQDLIEYTLLVAFVAFTTGLIVLGFGNSVAGITSVSNSQLAAADKISR